MSVKKATMFSLAAALIVAAIMTGTFPLWARIHDSVKDGIDPEIARFLMSRSEEDLLEHVIQIYQDKFGRLPPTENARLIKAMSGDNPTHEDILFPTNIPFNPKGEVIDAWGNSFQFRKVGNRVEVESPPPPREVRRREYIEHLLGVILDNYPWTTIILLTAGVLMIYCGAKADRERAK